MMPKHNWWGGLFDSAHVVVVRIVGASWDIEAHTHINRERESKTLDPSDRSKPYFQFD